MLNSHKNPKEIVLTSLGLVVSFVLVVLKHIIGAYPFSF